MNETDAFFTQTIVGAPFSVSLGRRLTKTQASQQGFAFDFETGQGRLTQAWQDWVVLSHVADPTGQPRRHPGALRRWLERQALWLAALGLFSLLVSALFWALLGAGMLGKMPWT